MESHLLNSSSTATMTNSTTLNIQGSLSQRQDTLPKRGFFYFKAAAYHPNGDVAQKRAGFLMSQISVLEVVNSLANSQVVKGVQDSGQPFDLHLQHVSSIPDHASAHLEGGTSVRLPHPDLFQRPSIDLEALQDFGLSVDVPGPVGHRVPASIMWPALPPPHTLRRNSPKRLLDLPVQLPGLVELHINGSDPIRTLWEIGPNIFHANLKRLVLRISNDPSTHPNPLLDNYRTDYDTLISCLASSSAPTIKQLVIRDPQIAAESVEKLFTHAITHQYLEFDVSGVQNAVTARDLSNFCLEKVRLGLHKFERTGFFVWKISGVNDPHVHAGWLPDPGVLLKQEEPEFISTDVNRPAWHCRFGYLDGRVFWRDRQTQKFRNAPVEEIIVQNSRSCYL